MKRRPKNDESSGGEGNWMNTYGDLVTLLLCFFVLLFSFSNIDAEKWKALVKSFTGGSGILDSDRQGELDDSAGVDPNFDPASWYGYQTDAAGVVKPQTTAVLTPKPTATVTPAQESTLTPTPEATTTAATGPTPKPTKKPTKAPTPVPANQVELDNLFQSITHYLDNSAISSGVLSVQQDDQFRIRLVASIIFEPGSDKLTSEASAILKEVTGLINAHAGIITELGSEGHTDSISGLEGDIQSKWDLAARRSARVLEAILESCVIDQSKANIYTKGYGSQKPIASNDTEEGRNLNNRVDILVGCADQ
ncbi:MAG: flagellar motor protein MotB [Clostridiaceae bacterium]|nr:flagellar motor protein MotB [Clostridiaceae bacterium]